ncbi:MAG: T9SS type A sorting domain-containing protein [Chitinophagaceae bacterium]
MKQLYHYLSPIVVLLGIALLNVNSISAQLCPDGSSQNHEIFSNSINVSSGFTNTTVKFKQIDPTQGMVTCVNLCVRVRSIITVSIENLDINSSLTLPFIFSRSDNVTGPGLGSGLNNTITNSMPYGAINMAKNDGTPGSGPDYFGRTNDILVDKLICLDISDSTSISEFYGMDSVTFNYNILASSGVAGGGNFSFVVSTQAYADFTMSYCICPPLVLPVNIYAFNVSKLLSNKAQLKWSGYDDATEDYHYVAQVSRNGRNFTNIQTIRKSPNSTVPYSTDYIANSGSGIYYFRIKQVYGNGYTRFSPVRQLELENASGPKFSVYPNPSTGIVGIKFDNNRSGQYSLKIFNALGQVLVNKELSVNSSSYNQVAKLKSGIYWVRITDKDTNESSVNQIIIK